MLKPIAALLICSLLACFSWAQPTCEEPVVVLEDDIENYAVGDLSLQSPDWSMRPGTTGATVSDEQASTGDNSAMIVDAQEALLLLGDRTEGHYILQWGMYIPAGQTAQFGLSYQAPTEADRFSTAMVTFQEGEVSFSSVGGGPGTRFFYPEDGWFNVYVFIDLDNDQARVTVNERAVGTWQFSNGLPGGQQLHAISFGNSELEEVSFFVDDVSVQEIPAAEIGQYCYTAETLDAPGFYSVPDLACWGGSLDQGGNGSGFKAHWYTYTPDQDGVLILSSCGGGEDTRGWILSGDCNDLRTVGVNDDQCDQGDGNSFASYREAVVTAGTTYYIVWDDAWAEDSFPFELGFSTDEPEEGEFCQSALDIQPGDYFIDELTGDAAVAGPSINNTSSSTTNYAQSKWYQFTPATDGMMSISSCELAASDTHFFVYEGDCAAFETLEQVAASDNDCGEGTLTSFQDSIEVIGGNTYYIEWIDRWDDELFQWTLGFESVVNTANVETVKPEFDIYPNPVKKENIATLRYDLRRKVPALLVQLMTPTGQQLFQQSIEDTQAGTWSIPLHQIPSGVYYLRLEAGSEVTTQRIVVQ